jgi:hypothetical protein
MTDYLKVFCLATICVIVLGQSSLAKNTPYDIAPTLGDDNFRSCSQWSDHARPGQDKRNSEQAWLLGFVSGYNAFEPVGHYKHLFFPYDSKNILDLVDETCLKSPQRPVADVITYFIQNSTGASSFEHARSKSTVRFPLKLIPSEWSKLQVLLDEFSKRHGFSSRYYRGNAPSRDGRELFWYSMVKSDRTMYVEVTNIQESNQMSVELSGPEQSVTYQNLAITLKEQLNKAWPNIKGLTE